METEKLVRTLTSLSMAIIIAITLYLGYIVPIKTPVYTMYLLSYYFMIWIMFTKLYVIDRINRKVAISALILMQTLGLIVIGHVFFFPLESAPVVLQSIFIILFFLAGIKDSKKLGLLIMWGNVIWVMLRDHYLWQYNMVGVSTTFYAIVAGVYTCYIYRNTKTIYPALFALGIACDWRELYNIIVGWSIIGKLYVSKLYLPVYSYLAEPSEYRLTRKSTAVFLASLIVANILDPTPIPTPFAPLIKRLTIIPAMVAPFLRLGDNNIYYNHIEKNMGNNV